MMPPPKTRRFRSIVCAVDFSPLSANALRYASALAGACGGTVTALFAADPLLSNSVVTAYDSDLLEGAGKRNLTRFLRATLGARRAADIVGRVRVGRAGHVIVAEARRLHADVVVLGTHGRRGVQKFLFGSTAQAVLRRCPARVLVVPPRAPRPRPGWPGGSIVAAIEAGHQRPAEITAAARIGEVFGAWLSVVPVTTVFAARAVHPMMILYPLPVAGRVRMFRQASDAYDFVGRAPVPVLIVRTGRKGGVGLPASRRAA